MTKRTVDFTIAAKGSAVVDVEFLLAVIRNADNSPWAKHLLGVYESAGVDALVQAYVKQAYSGGVNNLLRDWSKNGEPESEHGGRVRFAPAQCASSVREKPKLYPKDVPIGGTYKFANPLHSLMYKGRFLRLDDNHSQDEEGCVFEWDGHEDRPIELIL